ncbi:MAG: regulatory protein RecX [Candidatus Nanopelagicaceae bacterium]|nr:regulatory protein RecX [Candidatus Nanopelagicaceae bacterium]
MLISKEDALKLAGSGATSVAPDLVNEPRDYVGAAQTICLNALAVRAKSRGELAAQLKRRGIPLEVADEVLDRLERSKLINDLDFARAWSKSRLSSKKISKRVLAQELRRKEVADDLIAIALDEISSDDEYEAALQLGERKARSLQNYAEDMRERRITSALARKGYNYGIISRVLKEVC